MDEQRLIARAKDKAAKFYASCDRHRSRLEGWLVAGNIAGFAGVAVAVAGAKVHPTLLPSVMFSAWAFFFGAITGVFAGASMGAWQSRKAKYYEEWAHSREDRTAEPEAPADNPPGGAFWLFASLLSLFFALLVPLAWATAIAVSGRMPFQAGG
jgi:hypothetical protein